MKERRFRLFCFLNPFPTFYRLPLPHFGPFRVPEAEALVATRWSETGCLGVLPFQIFYGTTISWTSIDPPQKIVTPSENVLTGFLGDTGGLFFSNFFTEKKRFFSNIYEHFWEGPKNLLLLHFRAIFFGVSRVFFWNGVFDCCNERSKSVGFAETFLTAPKLKCISWIFLDYKIK